MLYSFLFIMFITVTPPALAAVCEGQQCQVILFDDFIGAMPDEDPACYTQIPNCSPRPEWGDTGKCKNLDSTILSKTAQLNKCRWKLWQGYSVYGREKTYRWDPNMIEVSNGLLTLTAKPSSDGVALDDPLCTHTHGTPKCAYISGGIDSRPSFGGEHAGFDFRYGKVEFRARMDMGPGAFPALWMFDSLARPEERRPIYDQERQYQEIDILEIFPDLPFTWRDPWKFWVENMSNVRSKAYQSLHWGVDGTNKSFLNDHQVVYHGDFHTYSVEWEPTKLVYKIDGKITKTITDRDSKNSRKVRIPDHEMYLILDLQLSRGKNLVNFFKKNVLQNDISQLKDPIRMQIDWVKVTSKKTHSPSLISFPHPPLVPGVKYSIKIVNSKPTIRYPAPCSWGGIAVGSECEFMVLNSSPLPEGTSYLVKTELTDGGPGVYYVTDAIADKTCPYGGTFIKTVGGEFFAYSKRTLYKNLCRLHLIKPNGPVLVPGISYSIVAPEAQRGFGIYYPQSSTAPVCPWGGKAMDLHDYYGSWWWIPICQVMELDRNKIDPLRSVEILMDVDPAKRTIRYRNDY
jgi:hypothetical protein